MLSKERNSVINNPRCSIQKPDGSRGSAGGSAGFPRATPGRGIIARFAETFWRGATNSSGGEPPSAGREAFVPGSENRGEIGPLQIGVAVPGDLECGVHVARDWVHRHLGQPDKVILRLDFRNAFNLVDRAAVLRAVPQDLPGLTCWADWCYSQHSRLLYCGGVQQQGDPLGPLLFSLALQPALVACDVCFAYLDDVVMAGDVSQLATALKLNPSYRIAPPSVSQALASYNQAVLPEDQVQALAPSCQQRELSASVDKAQLARLMASTPAETAKHHLQLLQQPGAGSLTLPSAPSDGFCPLCNGVADSFGEHARVCPCGGCGTSSRPSSPLQASAQNWRSIRLILAKAWKLHVNTPVYGRYRAHLG